MNKIRNTKSMLYFCLLNTDKEPGKRPTISIDCEEYGITPELAKEIALEVYHADLKTVTAWVTGEASRI